MSRFTMAEDLGLESVERVLGHGEATLRQARDRAATLDAVMNPGVLAPLEVGMRADGTVLALMPRIDGDNLAELLAARGGLRVGECVTVGVAVATALAAMHRAGIAHGDVSPGNIMIAAHRVTVVDTMSGASTAEKGTPGFAGPERGEGASAPGDVYSLGLVLVAAVRQADRELIGPWIDPLLAADPAVRPSAAMVARALGSCAADEPVERPMLGVADAMRAKASASDVRTELRDDGRWWRMRRRMVRWGRVGLVVAAVAVMGLVAIPKGWELTHPVEPPGFDPAIPLPANAAIPVATAAEQVTLARFAALVSGDTDALLATTADGSPARAELEPVAAALGAGELAVEGLSAAVSEVEVVSAAGRRAAARVTYGLSEYSLWDAAGEHLVPALIQEIEIDLVWSEAGWQVERVRAAST